ILLKGNNLDKPASTEFATRASLIRAFIQRHADWIAQQLECRMDEIVLLELEFPIVQLASTGILSRVPFVQSQRAEMQRLKKLSQSVELPPNVFPAVRIRPAQSSSGLFKNREQILEARWEDCPVLIRFRELSQPVVLAGIPVTPAENPGDVCDCVIVKRDAAPEFLQLIQKVTARDRVSRLCVYGGATQSIGNSGWDDLVLSDSVVNLVRKDFESFLHREEWFR